MAKRAKPKTADRGDKAARTQASKARRAARLNRKKVARRSGVRLAALRQGRRHRKEERARANGYPNHRTRRIAERSAGRRLIDRRDAPDRIVA